MTAELYRLLTLEHYRNLVVWSQLMKLHPWNDAVPAAIKLIEAGHDIYQQFNCASCGTKQTMDVANTFFEHGICDQCGHDTNIKHDGMNYMLHARIGGA